MFRSYTQFSNLKADYKSTSDLWRTDYILDHTIEGDAVELAAVLGSLLAARSIPFRYLTVQAESDCVAHFMVEALFEEADMEKLRGEASYYYRGDFEELAWKDYEDGNGY